jgi:hypothetical protein
MEKKPGEAKNDSKIVERGSKKPDTKCKNRCRCSKDTYKCLKE